MAVRYGEITDKVLEALRDFGPMTAREISVEVGVHVDTVSMVLTRCRRDNTKKRSKQPKRVYIYSYTRTALVEHETALVEHERTRDNPRMVFALGKKPDAKKPPRQNNAVRCRKKRANALGRVSSIFSIGARDMNVLTRDTP